MSKFFSTFALDMRNELLNMKGGQFVSLTYAAHLTPNKKHIGRSIICIEEYKSLYVGGDYSTKIQRKLAAAGNIFTYTPRESWGTHLSKSLIFYNGNEYMQAFAVANTTCTKSYLLDGHPATYDEIKDKVRPSELHHSRLNTSQCLMGIAPKDQFHTLRLNLDRILTMKINKKQF